MTDNRANEVKASFEDLYSQPDPRAYYSVLGSLDYAIPDLAKPIFRQIAAAWRARYGRTGTILDLGSSYGINAALFRYPLTFDMLRRRYARREMMALAPAELRALDRAYFRSWPRANGERIIAADISRTAVNYAIEVGLADDGVACDLERGAPLEVAEKLSPVDIVVSTGAVGYVTSGTFDTLLRCARTPPWVVSFCLRMFDYGPISELLAARGLATEKLESAAFVQRRFKDESEAHQVLELLRARGVDAAGLESEGVLAAELFVSRPRADVEEAPLEQIVRVVSGRHLNLGPRLVHIGAHGSPPVLAPMRS